MIRLSNLSKVEHKIPSSAATFYRSYNRQYMTQVILSAGCLGFSRILIKDTTKKLKALELQKELFNTPHLRIIMIKNHILKEAKKGNISCSSPNFENEETRIAVRGVMLSCLFGITGIYLAVEGMKEFIKETVKLKPSENP